MTQTKVTSDLITSVDASKLTGSLPASMATDLAPVRSDILKLALHQAIDGNRVAYNLEDSFIDGFEDDTGITTETTVDRDTTGEYVSTTVSGTTNATGTLISDPQTASTSRTSASGVIIYEDALGTSVLGTDLKIYFSCNNSAWTEASSYGTATTYSGTKKLVKLGATTCTAGTSVAIKAVWANQAANVYGNQTQVAQGTGTVISNMTGNASVNNAFDGNTSQSSGSCPYTLSTSAYIGKDWGSGNTKIISGVKIWAASNTGYVNNSSMNLNLKLYGSNSAPSNATDGTEIGVIAANTTSPYNNDPRTLLSGVTLTAYRYVWVAILPASNASMYFAEAEFYESTLTSAGKEARLHGWAVNY